MTEDLLAELGRLTADAGELARKSVRGGHDWYRISDQGESGAVSIDIYDEIGAWGVTGADFVAALDRLPVSTRTIALNLNSPGGSVFDGLAIASRLRRHPAQVHVTVDSVAASIASVIAMSGDTVTMTRGSQMMIHDPSGLVMGGAADMRQMADLLDKIGRDSIADAYVQRAGGTHDEWLARMADESWYSAEEAVAIGLATAVEGEQQAEPAARHDLAAYGFRHAGREAAPDPGAADTARRSRAAVARVRDLLNGAK